MDGENENEENRKCSCKMFLSDPCEMFLGDPCEMFLEVGPVELHYLLFNAVVWMLTAELKAVREYQYSWKELYNLCFGQIFPICKIQFYGEVYCTLKDAIFSDLELINPFNYTSLNNNKNKLQIRTPVPRILNVPAVTLNLKMGGRSFKEVKMFPPGTRVIATGPISSIKNTCNKSSSVCISPVKLTSLDGKISRDFDHVWFGSNKITKKILLGKPLIGYTITYNAIISSYTNLLQNGKRSELKWNLKDPRNISICQ
jgi:hypothetical protein